METLPEEHPLEQGDDGEELYECSEHGLVSLLWFTCLRGK